MKLRIHHNTIRLRLSQSEVKQIGEGLPVQQLLTLEPGGQLGYGLYPDAGVDRVTARYTAHQLMITIPVAEAHAWAVTDQVTLRGVQHPGTDYECDILIEKDFQCLHKRPDEDESDNFLNPLAEGE